MKIEDLNIEEPYYLEKLLQETIDKHRKKFEGDAIEFEKFINKNKKDWLSSIALETFKVIFSAVTKPDEHKIEIKQKIEKKYHLGLALLQGFITLNEQIGYSFYNKYFKLFDTEQDHEKLETLVALHVRACQVASEIFVLIENGFADGAHARWRTLHEICITFLFLYDGDYSLLEMYNDYEIIEKYKRIKEYQVFYKKLDWEPISDEEIKQLSQQREALLNKYGKSFAESYGWTMNVLPKGRRNIREIEKKVGKEYLRAIYAWSGDNVHSGVSGIRDRIGLKDDELGFFLTTSTDNGFIDPVQFMTYSLSDMTQTLFAMEDSLLNKVFEELLFMFQNEVVLEFEKQQNK